jgi:hypothetical protein
MDAAIVAERSTNMAAKRRCGKFAASGELSAIRTELALRLIDPL